MYLSTRGNISYISFQKAVLMGLATDGGLLVPAELPDMSFSLEALQNLSYPDLAVRIMNLFTDNDIPVDDLEKLVHQSYDSFDNPEVTPIVKPDSLYIMELFHGPTLAFKDVALQFLGNLFEYILKKSHTKLNIIGATSGDTGSAAIYGVRGKDNMDIFIMHPEGRVSPIQKRQMTTVRDDNVHNIAVKGTFDDTQKLLKELFNDLELRETYNLAAVNSVNWARVLAQIVYYFYAYFRMQEKTGAEKVRFCVPTGNFGNVFAGYLAWRMGLPIEQLILASNENDILANFFQHGVYKKGEVHATYSPSMDIQVASNFERYLYYRAGENPAEVNKLMKQFSQTGKIKLPERDPVFAADRSTNSQTLDTIRRYYEDFNYLLDPHTAVGINVAEKFESTDIPTVCLATAHPAKFPAAIREAVGRDCAHHPEIDRILELPSDCTSMPADKQKIAEFIANHAS